VELRGWALECRLAAEDPYNDFLPSLGRVDFVSQPAGPGIRVDSALFAGCDVSYYYDPMLAKVIAWGHDRGEAVRRMRRALAEFVIVGVDTNIPLHLQLLEDPRFLVGDIRTTFLESEFKIAVPSGEEDRQVALLAAAALAQRRDRRSRDVVSAKDGGGWKAQQRLAGLRGGETPERKPWRRSIG
jgi:acetyl/propionyl-CoA carboxylase alpha subunit